LTPSATKVPGDEPAAERHVVPFISLPISELDRGQRRLDGEAYLTGGYGVRLQAEGLPGRRLLSDLAEIWQPSRLKGIMVSRDHGLPFLAATQTFDLRPVPRKWLAPSRTPDLDRRFVERDWVLVTCSGTVGDAILAYGPHLETMISHDLLRVVVRDPADLGYVYFFIRTRFGRAMLRSSRYGSIIKHLEPEHAFTVPVPAVAEELRSTLDERARRVFALRDRAYEATLEAERRFKAAAAPHVPGTASPTFSVPANNLMSGRRRFDANHYNPSATAVEKAFAAAGHGVQALGDLVEDIILPNRFRRVFMETGVPYLGSEDIFKVNPEITKFIPAEAMKEMPDYLVDRGWLLVARSGQTYGLNGTVALATAWHQHKVISEDIIRVVPAETSPPSGYLQVAMNHPQLGRPLMLRLPFGSSVPHIAPNDLATFPLVRLKGGEEQAIADLIERAGDDRADADALEEAAIGEFEGFLTSILETTPVPQEQTTAAVEDGFDVIG
jgi:type I restriction enzyme, S subunit